jgi:transaldolase/glucose-6-phosphate isomerase
LREDIRINLGDYQDLVDEALSELDNNSIIERIWSGDHTVWMSEPEEIKNRLGWLNSPRAMIDNIKDIEKLADDLVEDGYTDALLLGMGGSSLASAVLRKIFGVREGYLDLAVLDSTAPDAMAYHAKRLDPSKTLFIVSTKSGTTVETLSFFKYFYNMVVEAVGKDQAGSHFIAITDPGSMLVGLANRYSFRGTYLNDPEIGGRYSALSYFGLIPAALMGLDIRFLLNRSIDIVDRFMKTDISVAGNKEACVILGTIMGVLAKAGLDKLTIVTSPQIESMGLWIEQLIAESTGKGGKGIVPVISEPLGSPGSYGDDRLFVCLCLKWDKAFDMQAMEALTDAGHPVVYLYIDNIYDLGEQIFLWEMATAVAGYFLQINPFNQPDVGAAKARARRMLEEYRKKGEMPFEEPILSYQGIKIFGDTEKESIGKGLTAFLDQSNPGDYVALQAYVKPESRVDKSLSDLRVKIRDKYGLATTSGYGPRFLHSTGQLHKGDSGKGLFIQLTARDMDDIPIPDEAGSDASSTSFGVLKAAQAIGDRDTLSSLGRRIIRVHFERDVVEGIGILSESLV